MTSPRYVVFRYNSDVAQEIANLSSVEDYKGLMQYPHKIVDRKGLYEFADGGIDSLLPYNGILTVNTRVRYQRIGGMNVREALWATGKFDAPEYSLCFRIEDAPEESLYVVLHSAMRSMNRGKAPYVTPIEGDIDRVIESFKKKNAK